MTALLIEYFKLMVLFALIASIIGLSRLGERMPRRQRLGRARAAHSARS